MSAARSPSGRAREARLRREIVAAVRRLGREGQNRGASGNASARVRGGFLVTPSGVVFDALRPRDLAFLALDDERGGARGPLEPSTEWRLHRDVYRARPEVLAIVHAHSRHAVALASLRVAVPAFHYGVARAGGATIRCARYATYGTQALSDAAVAALVGRRACLLANHGQVALGASVAEATALALEVEGLCAEYAIARAAGRPTILSDREMARIVEKFAVYGPRRSGRGRRRGRRQTSK